MLSNSALPWAYSFNLAIGDVSGKTTKPNTSQPMRKVASIIRYEKPLQGWLSLKICLSPFQPGAKMSIFVKASFRHTIYEWFYVHHTIYAETNILASFGISLNGLECIETQWPWSHGLISSGGLGAGRICQRQPQLKSKSRKKQLEKAAINWTKCYYW